MPKGSKEEQVRRERAIQEIIQQRQAKGQEAIVEKLKKRGIYTTQATISRYIKTEGLVKDAQGYYVLTDQLHRVQKQQEIRDNFARYALGGLTPMQIMMLSAKENHAAALAATVRECAERGVLGTVVDGDKVLVLLNADGDGEDAIRVLSGYLGTDD